MQKLFYTLALLLAAILLFSSCKREEEEKDLTLITDEGVYIGEIDDEPIRWATRNLNTPGTFARYPHSSGGFFQWGTLDGETHHFDNTTTISPDEWHGDATARDRVAWTVTSDPCPPGWRVPTRAELTALRNAGVSAMTELGGVPGRFFGTEPNRIFLPASGFRRSNDGALSNVGIVGSFWSNDEGDTAFSWSLFFSSVSIRIEAEWRSNGDSVRCVAKRTE